MALFHECTLQCARKELDTADIVREAMFNSYPQSFVLADRANFVVHPMLISVLGAGSVIEHGGSDLISAQMQVTALPGPPMAVSVAGFINH